jgi:hypothetical protein
MSANPPPNRRTLDFTSQEASLASPDHKLLGDFSLSLALFINLIPKIMARLYDASLRLPRLPFLWPFPGIIP